MKKETTIIRRFLTRSEAEKFRAKKVRSGYHTRIREYNPEGSKLTIYAVKLLIA